MTNNAMETRVRAIIPRAPGTIHFQCMLDDILSPSIICRSELSLCLGEIYQSEKLRRYWHRGSVATFILLHGFDLRNSETKSILTALMKDTSMP